MIKKQFMSEVYHSSRYKPFCFYDDYKQIRSLFTEPVINQQYSIELKDSPLHHADVVYPIAILAEHQLQLCYWLAGPERKLTSLCVLKGALLQAYLRWFEHFLKVSVDHFKYRESEKSPLIQHQIIRISIGDLVSQLELYKELITKIEFYDLAIKKMQEMLWILHKLVGGRSFLKGNIVDMLALLNIFQKIYFQ